MLGSVLRINSLYRILTVACSLGTIIYGTFLRRCLLNHYIILGFELSIGFVDVNCNLNGSRSLCICCTVLADNFGFRRRKALDFQTSVCQVTNKFLKLFFKKLDKSVFISFFHLPLTNTKIISPYRSPIHTPFEFPPYCGFSTITFRYMIKNK